MCRPKLLIELLHIEVVFNTGSQKRSIKCIFSNQWVGFAMDLISDIVHYECSCVCVHVHVYDLHVYIMCMYISYCVYIMGL